MLSKLRSFSKGKLATVLVAIIIIPFVFWGMGSVFSGGNTNSLAKINSFNISTKDFVNHINNSQLSSEIIKENINNNVLEDLLRELVANSMIDIEIKDLNIIISDKILAERIKKNKSFQDENIKFSRIKYEKFLLENNISATNFETRLRKNELKKNLFAYISGGIKSPYFMANKTYKDQTKQIELSYLNLINVYKKKDEFSNSEIEKFIKENKDKLKKELIDFTFIEITPLNLVQETEFSENFFSKIDEIENQILNGSNLQNISSNFGLKVTEINNFIDNNSENLIFKEIYKKRNQDKIQLIDKNDFFLIYEINNIKKVLPEKNNTEFIRLVKNTLFEKNKYNYNKELLIKIQNNNFTNTNFTELVNNKDLIKKIKINSIKENNLFSSNSIKLLYASTKNKFLLMDDKDNNIYLAKIEKVIAKDLSDTIDLPNFTEQANIQIRNDLYSSYDFLINDKYKITINQNSFERFKNHFK